MHQYKIIDNGQEVYIIEAENAKMAVMDLIQTYANREVLELYADGELEFLLRLRIIRIDEE